jgi:hypothetical protein
MNEAKVILAAAAAAVLSVVPAADDFLVSPGESIQAAIDLAADGDRVLVAAGNYDQAIDFSGKAITVIGLGGAPGTTIDATSVGGPVVTCTSGEGTDSVLIGFTITGGNVLSFAQAGAGINAWSSGVATSPTITDCIVRNNLASGTFGGGIAGNPTLIRCSIYDNESATGEGGGLYGAPQMSFCVVANNTVTDGAGGGLHVTGGDVVIEDCVFVENLSINTGQGGGVFVGSGASAELRRCLILANTADAGIMSQSRGGGVRVGSGGSATVHDCTVVDNVAAEYCCGTSWGGLSGVILVENSIVRGNSFIQISGLITVQYSNVEGGYFGTENIDLDPSFVSPGRRDLHLRAGSPCIDAGDPADLDPDGTRADIGAFYRQELYNAANATPELWSRPGWPQLRALIGGRQVLRADLSLLGMRRTYWALGSTSGTSPGIELAGTTIPLNADDYFRQTLLREAATIARPNGWAGALRKRGLVIDVPPGFFAPGTDVHHTFVLLAGVPVARVSPVAARALNPVLLEVE